MQSTRVAELRREAPGAAARRYVERLEEDLKNEKDREKRIEASERMDVDPLDIKGLERREQVEKMWARGTQGLPDLGVVPGVLAKLERAGKAAAVVEGM